MAGIRKKRDELKAQIIEVIENFYFENHHSPSMSEIAKELNSNKATVYRYIIEMNREHKLYYDGQRIRTSKINKADLSTRCIPIVGSISCGPFEETEEDIEEFVALPTALFGSGDFMILRASGESMIERGIDSGDLVVIERNAEPRDGDIVAIREESGTTLKQLFYEPEKKRIRLHPWNRTMKDIFAYDLDNVQVYGIAKHIIKKL